MIRKTVDGASHRGLATHAWSTARGIDFARSTRSASIRKGAGKRAYSKVVPLKGVRIRFAIRARFCDGDLFVGADAQLADVLQTISACDAAHKSFGVNTRT